MRRAENINPGILRWARETAGMTEEDAASKLGLTPTTKISAVEKLAALEEGQTRPTRRQLLKIASVYRRPLTVFYRDAPPPMADRGEDFRTLAAETVSRAEAALLDALVRDIRARQDMVRSILEDDEDVGPLGFVGSMSISDPVPAAANRILAALGFENNAALRQDTNDPDDLFTRLRNRVEQLGIFVVLAGNLGSHHTAISEKIFRGFAIADPIAPFIVVNDQDARAARSFTLIHELAHIFVGATGVSAAPDTAASQSSTMRVERFCNDVASEFLLPESGLSLPGEIADRAAAAERIRDVAALYRVSEPMVAYRFYRTGRISADTYLELAAGYAARWHEHRQRNREQAREGDKGGPNYYVVRRHRLGPALLGLVNRMLRANELTHTKAAKMLGVKAGKVEQLLRGAESSGGSHAARRG